MFKLEDVMQLKPGEVVRLVTKRHVATILPKLLLSFILIVVPFFFVFALFQTGPTGASVFIASVGVGIYLACRTLILWDGDTVVISNQRFVAVVQTGLFSRTVTEIHFSDHPESSWKMSGLLGRLLQIGDVTVTAPGGRQIVASRIAHPQYVQTLLKDAMAVPPPAPPSIERHAEQPVKLVPSVSVQTEPAQTERIAHLQRQLSLLDDASLQRVEQALKVDQIPVSTPPSAGDTIPVRHIAADDPKGMKPMYE